MPKLRPYFCLCFLFAICGGCNDSDRQQIAKSDYSVLHPQSWNADGHPGIFLYYKEKPLWFNVYCPEYGYHDGILVFEGDVPDSLFNGQPPGNENADFLRSLQIFAIRGAGPPVVISERIRKQSLKNLPSRVDHFTTTLTGLNIVFSISEPSAKETNAVSWQEIQTWLDEAEKTAPIRNSRMGKYRYLPLKEP